MSANRNLTKEQIATAAEIADIIAAKGWENAEVIAGTKSILRYLWIELKKYGIELKGYDNDANDEKCYARLMQYAKTNGLPWQKQPPVKPEEPIMVGGAGET